MALPLQYYSCQVGGGGGVKNVFTGARNQRGRGVGGWLGGLFRYIIPYVKSGVKTVGKETLRAGMHILQDVADGNASFSDSLRTRAKETGKTLRKKAADKLTRIMQGSGYIKRQGPRKRQSRRKRLPKSTGKVSHSNKKRRRLKPGKNNKKKSTKTRKTKRASHTLPDIFV